MFDGRDPDASALEYEERLRDLFVDGRPGLVILGMGDDGHTASIFPETAALHTPTDRLYVANYVPKLDAWRLTVTPALIAAAHHVIVIVTGAGKAEVVAEAIHGEADRHPVQSVGHCRGEVTWLLDEAAASALP